MRIILCALQARLLAAWKTALSAYLPGMTVRGHLVQTVSGDITALTVDAVVSPANSHGYMRGGVDLAYARFFGQDLENNLRRRIVALPGGLLPVGQALSVPTGHARIPYLVSAPTMETPRRLDSAEPVFTACRAATDEALRERYASLAFPGMGTGTGGLDFDTAAEAMLQGIVRGLERG